VGAGVSDCAIFVEWELFSGCSLGFVFLLLVD